MTPALFVVGHNTRTPTRVDGDLRTPSGVIAVDSTGTPTRTSTRVIGRDTYSTSAFVQVDDTATLTVTSTRETSTPSAVVQVRSTGTLTGTSTGVTGNDTRTHSILLDDNGTPTETPAGTATVSPTRTATGGMGNDFLSGNCGDSVGDPSRGCDNSEPQIGGGKKCQICV